MKDKDEVFKHLKALSVLLLTSFITIFVVSKNSPFFYLNDWVDLNAFLTVGKSWGHGLIPYKDIFEQKGPILYFIFLLASKISHTGYIGVYIIESLFFTLTSFMLYKIGRLFLDRPKSYLFVLLSYIILTLSPYFKMGGSAEEFSYPAILLGIYYIFIFSKNGNKLSKTDYFIGGFAFSYIFWIKYTMIGSWLGFYLAIGLLLIWKKEFNELFRAVLLSLAGFLSLSTVICLYFFIVGGLSSLYKVYFYSNMVLYTNDVKVSFRLKLVNAFKLFYNELNSQNLLFVIFILGLIWLFAQKRIIESLDEKIILVVSFLMLIITVYYGGADHIYYMLILLPFICLVLLTPISYMSFEKRAVAKLFGIFVVTLFLIMTTSYNKYDSKLFPNNETLQLGDYKDGPAQSKFAKIINKEKNPTLLNYGSLDLGFFQSTGIVPTNYYFERQNITDEKLPEMMQEQNDVVNNKKADFVVLRIRRFAPIDDNVPENIRNNYDLVEMHDQKFEGWGACYLLYKAKE
ncbi:glycosyltransferase family 39 protein [Floricoccus penangensis]|uniref:glycosyltransferase family 39 protein n=1 Tax=Floricoccus penangensis TaxID=1859475 RepID=UPI00203D2601|nr:glycosyltransferase family 39 protein [Floricoccus penangensis]URZ87580.1 hypothetical protein KIW23_00585 [Floricoccus penangensis]